MNKKIILGYISAIFVLLCIAYYYFNFNNNYKLNNDEIMLVNMLKADYGMNVKKFSLKDKSKSKENGFFYFFTFEYKNKLYEGVSYILEKKILKTDFTVVADLPFTSHQFAIKNKNGLEIYISGLINTASISYIVINCNNEVVVQIEPVAGKYYSYLSNLKVKEIVAYDKKFNEVFRY